MAPDSIPPLISALFLFALALVSLLHGNREKLNVIFALFSLTLSLSAFSTFLFFNSGTVAGAADWGKFAFVLAVPAPLAALYYALEVTGYIQYLHKEWRRISLKIFIPLLIVYILIIEALIIFTDLIIASQGIGGAHPTAYLYGSYYLPAMAGLSIITLLVIVILYRAYRSQKPTPHRVKIKYNLIGFATMYFPAGMMRLYLPYIGLETEALAFIPLTIAAFIFYLAILRYQFSQIKELNMGLEKKVEERTRKLKQAYAHLAQTEKMASLGKLVAGVVHETNTPVAVIKSNSNLFLRTIEKQKKEIQNLPGKSSVVAEIEKLIRINQTAAKRIEEVIISLKNFARLDEAATVKADLHEGIENSLILVRRELNNRIEIIKEYGDIPRIHCRANDINQVFMNLLLNAIQAIEGKGEIRIETGHNEKIVWVKIGDTGTGISQENLSKIFDPGFTTKGVGVGIGLGYPLAIKLLRRMAERFMWRVNWAGERPSRLNCR